MRNIIIILLTLFIISCENRKDILTSSDINVRVMSNPQYIIDKTHLGLIEGIKATDSVLVAMDYHDGKSYTLFDIPSGNCLLRFGEIGHGQNEIPMGCDGMICNKMFVAFDDETHSIATYRIDKHHLSISDSVGKYSSNNTQLSRLSLTDEGLFLGKGTYLDKYQYVLFDKEGQVYDYAFNIYNDEHKDYNTYHKFLANQGQLAKHPQKNLFVGTTNFSSNIEFFSVEGNKINEIKSINGGDPLLEKMSIGGINRMVPTKETINGFIDVAASNRYVYALYSDELFQKIQYCSDTIIVFNWEGDIICKFKMPNMVYYVAANSSCLYTVEKDQNGYYVIASYSLNEE